MNGPTTVNAMCDGWGACEGRRGVTKGTCRGGVICEEDVPAELVAAGSVDCGFRERHNAGEGDDHVERYADQSGAGQHAAHRARLAVYQLAPDTRNLHLRAGAAKGRRGGGSEV